MVVNERYQKITAEGTFIILAFKIFLFATEAFGLTWCDVNLKSYRKSECVFMLTAQNWRPRNEYITRLSLATLSRLMLNFLQLPPLLWVQLL